MQPRLRLVLDTNVLVAALRSETGASNALLTQLASGPNQIVATAALLFEYEAVLSRSEHLAFVGMTTDEMAGYLDALALRVDRVTPRFSWRPQLADAADEMMLEAAVNGRADAIVTFNKRHLAPAARFGVELWTPGEALRRVRSGSR